MKPLLSTAIFAFLLPFTAGAQAPVASKVLPKVSVGIKLGANIQELNGSTWTKGNNFGPVGGGYVAITKKRIGVQAEALLSATRIYYKYPPGYFPSFRLPDHATLLCMNVPVLFEYRVISHLWLQAGPQVNNLLKAKNDLGNNIKSAFRNPGLGAALGIQASLPLRFNIGARYIYGLTNLNNTIETGAWKTNSIQITGGFRIL